MSKRAIRSGFGSCCITGVVEGVEHFEIGMWQGPEAALPCRWVIRPEGPESTRFCHSPFFRHSNSHGFRRMIRCVQPERAFFGLCENLRVQSACRKFFLICSI
jgi:hypothetical protein